MFFVVDDEEVIVADVNEIVVYIMRKQLNISRGPKNQYLKSINFCRNMIKL